MPPGFLVVGCVIAEICMLNVHGDVPYQEPDETVR